MSRPMLARHDTRNAERIWAKAIDKRDGFVCRFEVLVKGKWGECGSKDAHDHCHIYPRRECGLAVFDEKGRTGIKGCRPHHNEFDGMGTGRIKVRVPPKLADEAYAAICEASKLKPPRRLPTGEVA